MERGTSDVNRAGIKAPVKRQEGGGSRLHPGGLGVGPCVSGHGDDGDDEEDDGGGQTSQEVLARQKKKKKRGQRVYYFLLVAHQSLTGAT